MNKVFLFENTIYSLIFGYFVGEVTLQKGGSGPEILGLILSIMLLLLTYYYELFVKWK